MVKRLQNRSGYSLAEAMIVVAILGGLVLVGPEIFKRSTQFFILHRTKLELQREARTTIALISRNLRQAQSGTLVLDRLDANQPFYSRVRFTHVDGSAVTFYQSGKALL